MEIPQRISTAYPLYQPLDGKQLVGNLTVAGGVRMISCETNVANNYVAMHDKTIPRLVEMCQYGTGNAHVIAKSLFYFLLNSKYLMKIRFNLFDMTQSHCSILLFPCLTVADKTQFSPK